MCLVAAQVRNDILLLILAVALSSVSLFWGVSAKAQMQSSAAQLLLPCFPSPFVDDAMASQGFTSRLTGAFDDGDLLVVYRDAQGRFMAGFATPQGQTCALGQGSGLEMHDIQAPKRGS